MKLNLTSLIAALALASPVDAATLRGLSGSLGLFQAATTTNDAASSCEPRDLDICIAIDRSGSICAPPGKSSYGCGGDPDCGCTNWDAVVQFANAFIDGISASDATNQFGLVKFSTSAGVESELNGNATEAMDAVTNLRYTSGWTNTTGALENCRDMLKDSTSDKAIVLITDGAPTRPLDPDGPTSNYDYAREQALIQAMAAKEAEGIDIVGVFVNTTSGTSDFLEKLTTHPGLYIEVTDFDELEGLSDSLVDLVQCPPPPPAPTPAPALPSRACEQENIDVCIAIDRSGSVCGPPYLKCNGDPNCGENCTEWNSSIEFAKELVKRTDELPGAQRFALVGFASTVKQESFFVGADDALDSLSNLAYTGGWTHTGGAIDACADLLNNDSQGQKTMVILTDGIPTRPDPDGEGSPYSFAKEHALERSISAKEQDNPITIIGVFIDTGSKTSSYLQNLVTPGYYLEAEFDELDSNLLDSLMSGVECSEPAPSSMPSAAPSISPSAEPSVSPTSSPTCLPKSIDVCVAIDRSGSICSDECVKEEPCDTCENWEAQIDFTEAFISKTETWDGEQQFALATFGNTGEVQSELVNATAAITALRAIPYKRHWTNTMDGLQYCRNLLANSATDDRIIVLVTDGSPTRPLNPDGTDGYDYAKEKATETATMVKEDDGTTLMTVAVGTSRYTSNYLAELASDGFAVEVDNFDNLDAISGKISARLSCA
jgi:Mg-chelatase subunit ChlD